MSNLSLEKITVIGDIAFDEIVLPGANREQIGGGAYNAAIAAALFHEDVGVVAKVGGDFNTDLLKEVGVNTDGIDQVFDKNTARFTFRYHPDGTRKVTADTALIDSVDTKTFPKSYLDSSHIHLSGSHPHKWLKWIEFIKNEAAIPVTISADTFEMFAEEFTKETLLALSMVDLIFLNEEEMRSLRQFGDVSFSVPYVLKKGSEGAVYVNGKKDPITIPAPKVEVLDNTGAGDVLAGVFLALLAKGLDPGSALERAVYFASLSATQYGVGHLWK